MKRSAEWNIRQNEMKKITNPFSLAEYESKLSFRGALHYTVAQKLLTKPRILYNGNRVLPICKWELL